MKKLLLLILLCASLLSVSYAQVGQIMGVVRFNAKVYLNQNQMYVGNLPAGDSVIIQDATMEYFIIEYKDGNAYIERNNVKCKNEQLKELKIFRRTNPLIFRTISNKRNNAFAQTEIDSMQALEPIKDIYKYEIDHIRYCAGRYNKEVMTGYFFSFFGSAVTVAAAFTDKPDIPIVVGAGLGLIGSILIIDSNKWMKKISIGPNGIGIKYVF